MELSKVTLEIFAKLEHQWLSQCESSKKTRVLSIDGGGTTAIVVGESLVYLEDQIRVKTGDPQARIADFFDLVAGTGVGAVLAALLVADDGSGRPLYSAKEVVKAVAEKSEKLFSFRSKGVFRRGRRCSGGSMEKALTELLEREGREGQVKKMKKRMREIEGYFGHLTRNWMRWHVLICHVINITE